MTTLATGIPNKLTLRDIGCRAVCVPLVFTLGTSAAIVQAVPLLLVDLSTEEGPVGRTYLFCYTGSGASAIAGHIREAADLIRGKAASPLAQTQFLQRRFALLGVTGTVRMALSAIDMAFWDAHARSTGRPLSYLLGGDSRPLPAYDSRGLGLMAPQALADEAEKMLALGLKALKLRLGYPTLAEDLAALDAVRNRVGTGVAIMVDYNQALTPVEALKRGHALDTHDILWLEEPIAYQDYRSYARLTHALTTSVQIGENFNGPEGLSQALAAGACDLVMPDVARIGGVTGWMQASGIAASAGIEMSSHLMPEISAQLLCATRCADCGQGESCINWPSHCRSTPELDQLRAHLSALMPYRVAAGVLAHLLPVAAGKSPETLRGHTLKIGEQLRAAAAVKPPAAASAITITLDATFIRSCHDDERHLEVRVGNVETSDGRRQVFASVARADTDIAVLIRRSLETVGRTADSESTVFTDGCPGLRSILAEAGITKPPIADWFHIALRLQHAKQAAGGLSTDEPGRIEAKTAIVAEVERLHWRIWHGKAKDAQLTLDRIRKAMHVFKGERGHRTRGVASRKLWHALQEVDNYLRGQSAHLVNYALQMRPAAATMRRLRLDSIGVIWSEGRG